MHLSPSSLAQEVPWAWFRADPPPNLIRFFVFLQKKHLWQKMLPTKEPVGAEDWVHGGTNGSALFAMLNLTCQNDACSFERISKEIVSKLFNVNFPNLLKQFP